jgi:hypothetical protein
LNLTAIATDATSYSWTGTNGFTSTQQNPVITNATVNLNGLFTVFASNGSCNSQTTGLIATTIVSPTISVAPSATTICEGQAVVLTPNNSATVNAIIWKNLNGTFVQNSLSPITVNPIGVNPGFIAMATSLNGCSASDTVYIHVNQRPNAVNDLVATCEETLVVFNVLSNDTDPENNPNLVSVIQTPNHGSVVNNGNGNLTYIGALNYYGMDTLMYEISNVQCTAQSDTALVIITLCNIQDPPVAVPDFATTPEETPITINSIINDYD